MAGRQIQTGTLIVGVVIGFILYAVFRHIFYILVGVAIGVVIVLALRRR